MELATGRSRRQARRYIVLNPRGLPAGAWIIRIGERYWYEGDVFDGPAESATHLLERGFLRQEEA